MNFSIYPLSLWLTSLERAFICLFPKYKLKGFFFCLFLRVSSWSISFAPRQAATTLMLKYFEHVAFSYSLNEAGRHPCHIRHFS